MVRIVVVICITVLVAGCASTPKMTTYTRDVAYLDENGETKIKTVEYQVQAPKRSQPPQSTESLYSVYGR
ncbi:MAG: hypothetical protein ACTHLT_20585 [Devosia sp.]